MKKTITIDELIKKLEYAKKELGGKMPVYLARDEEGNGYGTINHLTYDDFVKCLIIFPYENYLEYEELAPETKKCTEI